VSPGRKPDLPAIIRSGHLGRSNPGLKRATMTETRTTRTSRSSAEPFCPINQQPDFGQAVFLPKPTIPATRSHTINCKQFNESTRSILRSVERPDRPQL
jgi:hypothetical protein